MPGSATTPDPAASSTSATARSRLRCGLRCRPRAASSSWTRRAARFAGRRRWIVPRCSARTAPAPSWSARIAGTRRRRTTRRPISPSSTAPASTVRLSDTRYYGSQLLAWPDVPWLTALGVQRISPGNGYVAAPEAWDELVLSGNSGFAITTVSHALTIEQIQRGAVVGEAVLPDLASVSAGVAAFPMLAGSGARLLLVAQVYSGSSGLCHVVTAGKASIVRID